MSLGLVLRDLNLASANNVNGTPTLYINGQRIQGVKDVNEIRRLLNDARKEASITRSSVSETVSTITNAKKRTYSR
jgi:hypothetical protein